VDFGNPAGKFVCCVLGKVLT